MTSPGDALNIDLGERRRSLHTPDDPDFKRFPIKAFAMDLARLQQLLSGQGEIINGCDLSAEEAISFVESHFGQRPFCLVRDWTLLELEPCGTEYDALRTMGLEPILVYARSVVFDSRERFNPGDWVRSSFHLSHERTGFFFTRNTLYVLLGTGTRQRITLDELLSLG
ncbi:DUF6957 family protein [Pseudomonas neuropathica]